MLPVTLRRVLLAEHRVDFRKRFDGLLAEAYRVGAQPYDGDCIVFGDELAARELIRREQLHEITIAELRALRGR